MSVAKNVIYIVEILMKKSFEVGKYCFRYISYISEFNLKISINISPYIRYTRLSWEAF